MIKIMFVCLGNICRSPMAELILKDYVHKAHMDDQFVIASSATNDYNVNRGVGSYVYPPAREILAEHGISTNGKRAQVLKPSDYHNYDLIIGMDVGNYHDIVRICGGDPEHKIHLLMDYTKYRHEIADPYFTGDFKQAYKDISEGCQALFNYLTNT
ncbi:MAG: low molecular weight phosphotyrosine protein phosphatase [Erysipelotrichaceae bacterium]|nr:low molecular weight phosphotyrosine protein phosphatase [Erysipelotrichaceae bacterium]